MGLKEGSVVPVNLACGHGQISVTLISGHQRVRCAECGQTTYINISTDRDGNVTKLSAE